MPLTPRALAIGIALVFLWIFVCYEKVAYDEFSLSASERTKAQSKGNINLSKEDFIATAKASAVEDDFDYSHIKEMCDNQP